MKIKLKADPLKKRVQAYPSIEDQLDAIWKGGADEAAMRKIIKDIKLKFPKKKHDNS